jgi:peptide/nickel transport system substrate-binding protein
VARISRGFLVVLVALLAVVAYRGSHHRDRPGSARPAAQAPSPGGSLVASLRSDPATYNRLAPGGDQAATDYVTLLTQARLVRINRVTDELEPWLAERWDRDGRTYTLHLRLGLQFSDGEPFSADDVIFSFRAVYDPAVESPVRSALEIEGRPIEASAPDAATVVLRFPADFGPGLRILDNLPILPRHKLAHALASGRFRDAWTPAGPPTDVVGMGPFVLREHISGQRLVFARNPHYFRRDDRGNRLPYLDTLTLRIVPDQSTEALLLQNGEIDFAANAGIRPDDYATFKALEQDGRLTLRDIGVSLDADFLFFNLARPPRPGSAPIDRREFRQAVSAAVDRRAIANGVYLGAAEPIAGPITPGNRVWRNQALAPPPFDPARAKALFAAAGLRDADGDGRLENADGRPARLSILTQAGHLRSRVAAVLQEQLRGAGLAVDLVTLDPRALVARWAAGDYEAIYFGLQASATDPALSPEFWLSSGPAHVWHASQASPATAWEARIDALFHEQATSTDPAARHRAFDEIQRILVDEAPALYFVAPHVIAATSHRVVNATPALLPPQFLWNAESLASSEASPEH